MTRKLGEYRLLYQKYRYTTRYLSDYIDKRYKKDIRIMAMRREEDILPLSFCRKDMDVAVIPLTK